MLLFSEIGFWAALVKSKMPDSHFLVQNERYSFSELVANSILPCFTSDLVIANTKGLLRIIQSIPSPKAEPFKMWLAQVGSERLDEIADPENAIVRGADFYRAKGYTEGWINQRMQTIEMRKELTDEWKNRGIEKEKDYAILTNEMTKAWSGFTVGEYKQLKGLKNRAQWFAVPIQQRHSDLLHGRLSQGIYQMLFIVPTGLD